METTKDGFSAGGVKCTDRDRRYTILHMAICDYFDALRDDFLGRKFPIKEAKELIATTCVRVLNGI